MALLEPERKSQPLELSPFQERVLCVPEIYDVFLGGGRGGAKSYALALLALRHAEQYGDRARVLYIRQSYKGLADFESLCRELFGKVYGKAARYNATEHVWRLPSGAYMELGQLEGPADYAKYQGRSFTLLLVDEAGQYATPELLDKLRSNLRAPEEVPVRMVVAANPGDVGHQWLAARYVFRSAPWIPFLEAKSGRQWVYAPSTFVDNPFIEQEKYRGHLEASCPADPELLRAWLEGDWAIARGAYFAGVLDESRNAIDPWKPEDWRAFRRSYIGKNWQVFLAHDFGVSAPSVTYLCADSPGSQGIDGAWYPKDSLLLLAELATNQPAHLDRGMGYTVPRLAEEIKDLAERWGIKPDGVADDAIFSKQGYSAGSIAHEFRRCGVYFRPAKKADRLTGWQIMRRLLADAGKPDRPGLYVARSCEYFWQTVPYLGRDPRRAEDLDTRAADHAADAVRYACLRRKAAAKSGGKLVRLKPLMTNTT